MHTFAAHSVKLQMTRNLLLLLIGTLLLTACGEYNAVLKSKDVEYKYEVAKAYYVRGQYGRATDLFSELLTSMKNTSYNDECLYMLAMSAYMDGDLESASNFFRRYYTSYPRGVYVDYARYYSGRSLYEAVPDPRLDQTSTRQAIEELQHFLDFSPDSRLKEQTQEMIQQLQDHLVEKEYLSAKLYYDLGAYVINSLIGGSNYEACIVTSENALRDYPYLSAARREQFSILILRSKYYLARQSVEEKRVARYREMIDEYYAFANDFPESQFLKEAQSYFTKSQRAIQGLPEDE